jgi:transposase
MARTSSEQWAKRVERWKESGLSAKEFAAETGLKASTLAYWRWRLSAAERSGSSSQGEVQRGLAEPKRGVKRRKRTATTMPACVELPVAAVASTPMMLELLFGEVRVRVPSGFDEATLARVVRALGAAR